MSQQNTGWKFTYYYLYIGTEELFDLLQFVNCLFVHLTRDLQLDYNYIKNMKVNLF